MAPAVVAGLAGLAHLAVAAHLAQPLVLPVRAHLVLLALLRVVVVPPVVSAEAVPLHLLSRQSFSAAMAGSTP